MQFEFYGLAKLEQLNTFAYDLELRTIPRGKLKGVQYFIPASGEINETSIPDDFAYNEFLNLNPDDTDQLTEIQRSFGMIASPVFGTDIGKNNQALKRPDDDLREELNDYLKPNTGIPLQEAKDTATYLQALIRSTIAVNNDEYTEIDLVNSETFNKLASRIYAKNFQAFGLAENNTSNDTAVINNLSDAVVIQQMKLLAIEDKKVHRCAYRHCGKYFKYEKRERFKPPYYCKTSHQEAEKSCRQNDKKRIAREADNGKE